MTPARTLARLTAAATAAAALAAPVALPPASAAPYAGTWRSGIATFALVGHDGRPWQLTLQPAYTTAVSTSNQRNTVIRLTQCQGQRCSYSRTWQLELGAADVTEAPDASAFTVKGAVGGTAFSATWSHGQDVNSAGTITGTAVTQTLMYSATATLAWGRLTCQARPGAQVFETTQASTGEPFSPGPKEPAMPRGLLGPRLRCG